MAEERLQENLQAEDRRATMSRWATAPLVIPLLTGLDFVATTVFAYLGAQGNYGHGSYGISNALPMAIICFVLGVGLGFLLRQGVERRLDSKSGLVPALVVVGALWVVALLFQATIFWWLVKSF